MKKQFLPIITASELSALKESPSLILVDASGGKDALVNFQKVHLKNARFVDLETQLADIKADAADGGRHPLPPIGQFLQTLESLGISPQSHVVVYDDKSGSNAAARLWWMLRAVGHEQVQVLSGGLLAAQKANYPMSDQSVAPKRSKYTQVDQWQLPLATLAEVEQHAQDEDYTVIDVRDAARYRGETEPIDLVAGHIQGAINVPFMENMDAEGHFLSSEALNSKYQRLIGDLSSDRVIVHCGSGVTACHTLLAIAHAGMPIPKLYVGSWSEWSRNGKEIAKET